MVEAQHHEDEDGPPDGEDLAGDFAGDDALVDAEADEPVTYFRASQLSDRRSWARPCKGVDVQPMPLRKI